LHSTHSINLTLQNLPIADSIDSRCVLNRTALTAHALQYFFGPCVLGNGASQDLQNLCLSDFFALQSKQNLSANPVLANNTPQSLQFLVFMFRPHAKPHRS
jgi:hypothetical protein